MDIAIALLPALFWGSMILFTVYIGGTAYSQILGITVGALLFVPHEVLRIPCILHRQIFLLHEGW